MGHALMYDILVIGGGINGVGIARDAAGRGLKVLLCEKDDLASHTSSASSKMIHGGLRYLENYEFRLVKEALEEREALLRAAPHINSPMRLVLPVEKGMRPAWMLRIGLFLYDHLAKRAILPPTKSLDLRNCIQGEPLKAHLRKGFEYSDCWTDDARLVAINAVDAAERGTEIRTRTECTRLARHSEHWEVTLQSQLGAEEIVQAKMVINAAGPWVGHVLNQVGSRSNRSDVRLVKGSHIAVPRMYEGTHSYIFQSPDGRVIFAMPFRENLTLIGTTEKSWELGSGKVEISQGETDYLCDAANAYFEKQISPDDVVWSYAGVRPLYEDHAGSASSVTRDYVFDLDDAEGAPILSIYGGKLTTYRKLAEHAMEKVAPYFPKMTGSWTRGASLPGGDFPYDGRDDLRLEIQREYSWLPMDTLDRLIGSYGTRTLQILGSAKSPADLGRHYGCGLYQVELDYLIEVEFAHSAEDILWRRSKLGLALNEQQKLDVWQHFDERMAPQHMASVTAR